MESLEELIAAVYRQHRPAVFRMSWKMTGNKAAAEDLTQEVFVRLLKSWERVDQSRVEQWLITATKNLYRDRLRREFVERKYADVLVPAPVRPPDMLEEWVLGCEALQPQHRTCLMMKLFDGYTQDEIAAQLGVKSTQVKGYLQYGMKLLRKFHAAHNEP